MPGAVLEVEEEASLFTFLDLPERQVKRGGTRLFSEERERESVRARDHTHQASYNACACAAYALFQNCVLYIFFVSISFFFKFLSSTERVHALYKALRLKAA